MLGAGLSRSTLVQSGLDCKIVKTGFTLKLAYHKVSTKRLCIIIIGNVGDVKPPSEIETELKLGQ